MPRFSLKHLLLGTAIIAAGLAVVLSLKRLIDPFDNEAFTPAAWAKADDEGRARMSRDLIHNHLRRGLSQGQVEALIGPAFHIQKPGDAWKVVGAEAHVYGIESFGVFGIDDAVVRVHYDASMKVIEAEITYD